MYYLYKLHAQVFYGCRASKKRRKLREIKAQALNPNAGLPHHSWKSEELDLIIAGHSARLYIPNGTPYPCVVVAYSSRNFGWTWSLEIACAAHSLSLSHTLPYLLNFLWPSMSTRAAPIHKGRLPRHTTATQTLQKTPVLVRVVNCLTFMTYCIITDLNASTLSLVSVGFHTLI
jgi:hypothetical protein